MCTLRRRTARQSFLPRETGKLPRFPSRGGTNSPRNMTRKTWDQDVDNVHNHPWARLFTKPPQNQLDCHIRDRGSAVLSNAVCSSNEALDGTQSMKNPLIIGLIVYA